MYPNSNDEFALEEGHTMSTQGNLHYDCWKLIYRWVPYVQHDISGEMHKQLVLVCIFLNRTK